MDYKLGSDGEWNDRYDALVLLGNNMFGVKIGYKDESGFMRFLGRLLFFVPAFMTVFTTTIGNRVWFPSRDAVVRNPRRFFCVLAHELVHVERFGGFFQSVWFGVRYLFPQVLAPLALLSIGAFWSLWWLLALVFLVAAAPLPAPGRVEEEVWGYSMSNVVEFWRYGRPYDGTTVGEWIAPNFIGWNYYRMSRDAQDVTKRVMLRSAWMQAETTWKLGHYIRLLAMGGPRYLVHMTWPVQPLRSPLDG